MAWLDETWGQSGALKHTLHLKLHFIGRIPVAWNQTYWDIQDQLYWSPHYLGLKSIPQKLWLRTADHIAATRLCIDCWKGYWHS